MTKQELEKQIREAYNSKKLDDIVEIIISPELDSFAIYFKKRSEILFSEYDIERMVSLGYTFRLINFKVRYALFKKIGVA